MKPSLRPVLLLLALATAGCAMGDRSAPPSAATQPAAARPDAPGTGPGQHVARRAMLEVRASFRVPMASAREVTDAVRRMGAFAEQHQGWVQSSTVDESGASGQVTLRVPPDALGELRAALARAAGSHGAVREQVTRTDVTDALMDLDARLRVARATEARVLALLDQRGALADVLAVERALAEQRTQIERMESEQRSAQGRVDLATVDVWFVRNPVDLRAPLGGQLAAAAKDGVDAARAFAVGGALLALRAGPVALMLGALTTLVWWASRRLRRPTDGPRR